MIDPTLLEILACPNCESRPLLRLDGSRLICDLCASAYPIIDGIPHLLPEDAQPLNAEGGGVDGR